jgi:hypothetical protein
LLYKCNCLQDTRHPTPPTAHRKSHPVTHTASAPHSRQSSQAAQRRRDAAGELVAAQPQLPAGHTISHRVTPWHPTPPPTPARPPATHRSASHSINHIKSNEKPVSTLPAIAHAQYRVRVTPHNQTVRRYLTLSSHHKSQRHCDARSRHSTTTATPCTCKHALGTQQQNNCKQRGNAANSDTAAQHPSHGARNSAGNTRPRRALYITRTTFFTFSQA